MVSSYGRVMSTPKEIVRSNGYRQSIDGRILSPSPNKKGYLQVALTKDKKLATKRIHRLVAEAFLPHIDGLSHVNHIDEDKTNNSVANLEWCNVGYNNNYGTRTKRIGAALSMQVEMIAKGMVVATFDSTIDAAASAGTFPSHISECCTGKRKTAAGFEWRYKED